MDQATVKKIASLACLSITEAEQDKYATQLGNILKWAEQLAEINTDHVEPLANVVNINLRPRQDIVNDGDIQADILANAPETLEGFFAVPKVVE